MKKTPSNHYTTDEDKSQSPIQDQAKTTEENVVKNTTSDGATFGAQIAELTNDLQRTRADFENFRKAVETQKSQAMATAKYATVVKFLPLVDDFSRAIDAYGEQLAPLRKTLDKTLQDLGLTLIDSAPGTEFNPDLHEAILVEDDAGDTEVIAETLRPGYLYDGAVIRAAMVKVKHQ